MHTEVDYCLACYQVYIRFSFRSWLIITCESTVFAVDHISK